MKKGDLVRISLAWRAKSEANEMIALKSRSLGHGLVTGPDPDGDDSRIEVLWIASGVTLSPLVNVLELVEEAPHEER